MAKSPFLLIVVGALGVTACGEMTPAEQAEAEASFACVERASAVFPVLAQMPESGADEPAESSGDFQVDAAGGFAWTSKVRGKNRPLPDQIECRGNLNGRTIEFIELNGVTKRPNPSEIWKF